MWPAKVEGGDAAALADVYAHADPDAHADAFGYAHAQLVRVPRRLRVLYRDGRLHDAAPAASHAVPIGESSRPRPGPGLRQ